MEAWLKSEPWYVRLDEWQHGKYPSRRPWFWIWHYAWRPLCNFVERHNDVDVADLVWLRPTPTVSTGATPAHTVFVVNGRTSTSCTVANCATCAKER